MSINTHFESSPDRLTSSVRVLMLSAGLLAVLLSVSADRIGLGRHGSGFGSGQIVLLTVGAALILAACMVPRLLTTRQAMGLLLVGGTSYVALMACELLLFSMSRSVVNPNLQLRGMYTKDKTIGFRLTSNWIGVYEDGKNRLDFKINSFGHRDDEPSSTGLRRVLLIGDSFAFGYRLDQADTIDKQMEYLTNDEVMVYNIGVQGYGPPAILESMRRCQWFDGTDVVYLFFNNDLRSDNLLSDMGLTCFDGYLVSKYRQNGQAYGDVELSQRIQHVLSPSASSMRTTFKKIVTLSSLRALIRSREIPQQHLLDVQGPGNYAKKYMVEAVSLTKDMRTMATNRGMKFYVAILPTRGETISGRHAELVDMYIQRLQRANISVIDLLGILREKDYYPPPDIHIHEAGAGRVAGAIIKGLGE